MSKKRKKEEESLNAVENINFFYGIPHAHTTLSTGRATPLKALEYCKNNDLDFLIITDHNNSLNSSSSKNSNTPSKWQNLKSTIERFNKKHEDFVGLIGFEANSSPYGHLNIINSSTYFTGTVKNINTLALWMIQNSNSIAFINHPSTRIESLLSPSIYNRFLLAMEVGNGCPPKYNRYYKIFFSMLDRGWKLSAINGQDNHKTNFGDFENLTGIICKKLTHKNIIESFKNGKTFSTESKHLKFYFKINDCFMGDTTYLNEGDLLNFFIYCEDSVNQIEKITIFTNGGQIIKEISNLRLNKVEYIITLPYILENSWYVVKLTQSFKKEALSSPVYVYEKEK